MLEQDGISAERDTRLFSMFKLKSNICPALKKPR
jgi:hypothetical protein